MFRRIGGALIALAPRERTGGRPDDRIASTPSFDAKKCKHQKGTRGRGLRLLAVPRLCRICACCSAPATSACTSPTATGRRTTSRCRRRFPASTTSMKAPSSGASRSSPTARRGRSPPSCAGTSSPPRTARKRPARSRATGRVLVVTRLGPGGVCHVGYVDATRQSGCERTRAQDRRRARAHLQVRQGQADRLGKAGRSQHAAGQRLVLPAERHLIEALRRRSARMSARPRGRRAPCRNRPPARCRSAPRSPGSSARSAPGRAAPP